MAAATPGGVAFDPRGRWREGRTGGASLHTARGLELNPMHAEAVERALAGVRARCTR